MECNAFHIPYLSDKIPEAVFHGQAVKTVAYLRVSTAQQDVRSQRLAILEYARKHDFRIDDFIEATASRQASEKRRRLDELMNVLQRGDRLVVSALFALFAEVERDLISERTARASPKAKVSGRKLGRPKGSLGVSRLNGKEDAIRRFLELSVSKTAIAKLTGVSRTTLYSFMSTRGSSRTLSVYFCSNLVGTLSSVVRVSTPGPAWSRASIDPAERAGVSFTGIAAQELRGQGQDRRVAHHRGDRETQLQVPHGSPSQRLWPRNSK